MYRKFMQINSSTKPINIGNKAFVFGGAYGNLHATQAILKKATELGFASSQIIFTGDMVAYCAKPVETIELIKSSVDHIIMGNCEEAIAKGANDCGCGFEEGSECSILSNQWYEFCKERIDVTTANWMGNLPRELIVQIGSYKLLATHATPDSINQFIFPSDLISLKNIDKIDGYIVGHSGIPFIAEVNQKPWLNSGASGMPANDGTPRVWYATIENENHELSIQTHALDYDFKQAQSSMNAVSLNNGYMQCLETGIWPSDDVLPYPEKMLAGIALNSQKKAFKITPFREPILA